MTQSGLGPGPGPGPSKPKVTLFHRLTHVLYINLNKMGWLPINGDALGRGEVSFFRLIMHHEHHKVTTMYCLQGLSLAWEIII